MRPLGAAWRRHLARPTGIPAATQRVVSASRHAPATSPRRPALPPPPDSPDATRGHEQASTPAPTTRQAVTISVYRHRHPAQRAPRRPGPAWPMQPNPHRPGPSRPPHPQGSAQPGTTPQADPGSPRCPPAASIAPGALGTARPPPGLEPQPRACAGRHTGMPEHRTKTNASDKPPTSSAASPQQPSAPHWPPQACCPLPGSSCAAEEPSRPPQPPAPATVPPGQNSRDISEARDPAGEFARAI
jgi:hypothetical protein